MGKGNIITRCCKRAAVHGQSRRHSSGCPFPSGPAQKLDRVPPAAHLFNIPGNYLYIAGAIQLYSSDKVRLEVDLPCCLFHLPVEHWILRLDVVASVVGTLGENLG